MRNSTFAGLIIILISGSILQASTNFFNKTETIQLNDNKERGFAVVELFTSEGCSSCPPADKAMAELLAKGNPGIFILSYHVDYWNRLGWKDEFSKHSYSERQQQYARHLSLESVYTPQVVVNGTAQFVGSDKSKLNAAIETCLQNDQQAGFGYTVKKKNNSIIINYNIKESEAVILNTALVQSHASTLVKSGENGGRTLDHVNIVREMKAIEARGEGELTMEIPNELSDTSFQLIIFTQSRKNFKVLGAEKVSF
jgi:hypothetical protein